MEASTNGNGHPTAAEYRIYDIYDLRAMRRGHRNRIEAAQSDTGPINGVADLSRPQLMAAIIADSEAHARAIERVLRETEMKRVSSLNCMYALPSNFLSIYPFSRLCYL